MSNPSPTVTIPNVTLTLEQLLTAVRQLDEPVIRALGNSGEHLEGSYDYTGNCGDDSKSLKFGDFVF